MSILSNLIVFLLMAATASCQTKTVLICNGNSSYAYHDHFCAGLNRCRAKVEKVSLSNAKSLGRTPCHYCYQSASTSKPNNTVSPARQGQCSAITKKGTRCSRSARSGGRCWQHGG